jgi:hypothetical protein
MACVDDPSTAPPAVFRLIKTECGRAKYARLAEREGIGARLRLAWFLLIAALRDWRLPDPDPPAGGSRGPAQSSPTGD